MKRISKRVRDQAIVLLLLAADEYRRSWAGYPAAVGSIDAGLRARQLAMHAWRACASSMDLSHVWGVWRSLDLPRFGTLSLESAALLRDGWNPGDPVEVRQ